MRRFFAVVAASMMAAACGGTDVFVAPEGTSVALNGGNNQTVAATAATSGPLEVTVTGANGAPLGGIPVTWTVVSGGGTVTGSGPTSSSGVASATYTSGTTSGTAAISANIQGAAGSPVMFSVIVTPGPAAVLTKVSGDLQTAGVNATLSSPFRVRVTDAHGNGVAGTIVSWTVPLGGGTISPGVVTDASGFASATYTTGTAVGAAVVTAAVPGLTGSPVTFSVTQTGGVSLVKELLVTNTAYVHDQFVRGGIAFVSAWDRGLLMYDVGGGNRGGTPSNPVLIQSIVTASNGVSGGAQVHNAWWYWAPGGAKKYVFVGQEGPASGGIGVGSTGDIHVVDVSDMSNPVEVAYYHMSGLGAPRDSAGVHNFWVDEVNEILYAAYYNGGVVAINVSGTLSGDLATREIARVRPGNVGNTYIWGVQLYNGSLYATDMLSGFWQLKLNGNTFSVMAGGNNVPERYGSDQWVANGYAYSGTWGTRGSATGSHPGNALKIWQLGATGAPILVDSIITIGIGTVSDVEVSADGRMLMFSAEGGGAAGNGIYFYSLVSSKAHPTFIARYAAPGGNGIHTATFAEIGGRRYVFAAKDPGSPSELILDVTPINP